MSENKSWINCYETEGYKQLIENFTRVSDSSSLIIDHIYVNKSENISNYGVLQCAISDHQSIFAKRKLSFRSKTKNIKHKTIKYQDFKNINVKRVENDLLNMEMKLKDPQDLNEICNQYNEEIHRIMKKHIKTKEVRIKHKMHEWVNQDIIELMKRRDKLRIKIINYREQDLSTNSISNELRHIRNLINIMIRQRKEHYMYEKIRSCEKNNITLWKALSEVVPIKAMVKKSQNEMISKLSADELNSLPKSRKISSTKTYLTMKTSTQWKKSILKKSFRYQSSQKIGLHF